MNPEQQPPVMPQPQGQPQINNPLSAMRDGETVLFQIQRHPMGIISTYLMFGVLIAIVGVVALMAPGLLSEFVDRGLVATIGLLVFAVTALFTLIVVFVAHKVYYGNRWILTSDSLTQVTQSSLFNKQSSQLGLDNLEDVTVDQKGILASIFKYGTLRGQTAGEHSKFMLTYCPHPHEYAQKMLMAREHFEHGEEHELPGAAQTQAPAQSQPAQQQQPLPPVQPPTPGQQ